MGIAATLLILPLLQDPAGQPENHARFVWPPEADKPLTFEVRLEKTRHLDEELFAAERKARRELGLHAPRRQPRQSVGIEMEVRLDGDGDFVQARCSSRLAGRPDLRIELHPDPDSENLPPTPLGNARVEAVWGLPDEARAPALAVPRGALERSFEQRFRRDRRRGVVPTSFAEHFGEHLLPVLWDRPLPCWFGNMAAVVELSGEAAILGKSLIRDSTGSFPLGHRESRVKLDFTKVSGSGFTFTYGMKIRQVVGKSRDVERDLDAPFDWHLEIEGEADYSVDEQAPIRIRETIRAWPSGLRGERLARVRDEAFRGTIQVDLVREKGDERRRGR